MFPNPGQQAAQRAAQRGAEQSARQAAQDGMRAAQLGARRGPARPGRGGGLLSFLLLVAVVVLVARDPELRASVLQFVHHVVNVVQNRADGS
ncbi:hypothetical protein OH768_11925 [Streptomyces sp. NBC_01622]|uniref:hypothetical protein n=1 Tax=Streptomyces sp. NBC_01622 TaxID=2975903 RepID=UPI00386E473A|nr:hypothetical protein OH768_11925 [Streptomyces sp. NBC_01622]